MNSSVDRVNQAPAAVVSDSEPPTSTAATVGEQPVYASVMKVDRRRAAEPTPMNEYVVHDSNQLQNNVDAGGPTAASTDLEQRSSVVYSSVKLHSQNDTDDTNHSVTSCTDRFYCKTSVQLSSNNH